MLKLYRLICLLPLLLPSCAAFEPMTCEDNWQLTGYFVPVESDYVGNVRETITLETGKILTLSRDFIVAVRMEGWGKTNQGWYLGWYGNQWHKSEYPLNANGQPLTLSTIATDTRYLPFGRKIYIPSLDSAIKQPFKVQDVGQAIKGKHIDIFTGEGKTAQLLTYQVTNKHKVCWFS